MSNLLNIKDQNGNWIPIPVVTNGIKSITQNEDYTLTITLNDGTTYTTTSIKGEDGQDYILTEQDKQDIAGLVDTPVDDVRINGQSIVESGVANIPYGSNDNYGLLKASSTNGIFASGGVLSINNASESDIKGGTEELKPLTPNREHMATFYGLAKASGDSTQSQSDNEVGVYTDEAKASIKNMLGVEDVDIDSKAPVITETATGSIVSFDDGADGIPLKSCIVQVNPVQDLHGYDHPWPAGGGKNLFYKDKDETNTLNGVTATFDAESQTISVVGTNTSSSAYVLLNLECTGDIPREVALARTLFNAPSGVYINLVYRKNGFWTAVNNGDSIPAEIDTTINLQIGVYGSATSINATNIKAQIELGSTATDYAPYENICPISGWTGCEVQRTGKNLLSNTVNSDSTNGITFTVNEDRSITANGTATARANLFYSGALYIPPGKYYLSIGKTFAAGQCYFEVMLHKAATGSNYINTNARSGCPFTVEKGDYIQQIYFSMFEGKTINDTIYPQIELGSTATDYEPYQGNTYPITFPTEAGTVYGGYVDVTKGELVVDRAYAELTKDSNWEWNNNNSLAICSIPRAVIVNENNQREILVQNNLFTNSAWAGRTTPEYSCGLYFGASYVFVRSANHIASVDDLKAVIGDRTLQVVYHLATPITYQLTPQEIKTLLGQNNLWANTGDTEVEYRASTKMYIDKKITEAVAAALNS